MGNYTHTGPIPKDANIEMHKCLSGAMEILRPFCSSPQDLLINLTVAAFATGAMGAGQIPAEDLDDIIAAIGGSIGDQVTITHGAN